MPSKMSDKEIKELAKKRVKKKKDFYSHLGVYIGINILLIVIWALSGAGYPWFIWSLGIWGAFMLWFYLDTFIFNQGMQSDKVDIDKEVEKIKKEQGD